MQYYDEDFYDDEDDDNWEDNKKTGTRFHGLLPITESLIRKRKARPFHRYNKQLLLLVKR